MSANSAEHLMGVQRGKLKEHRIFLYIYLDILDFSFVYKNHVLTPLFYFCMVIVHEIILLKSTIPTGSISDKKAWHGRSIYTRRQRYEKGKVPMRTLH